MKKLLIYNRDSMDSSPYLTRSITVSADFIGIGNKGQINEQEFKKLAQDLVPEHYSIQIINA